MRCAAVVSADGRSNARSVSTCFDPRLLHLNEEGKLFHPVVTKAVDAPGGAPRRETLMALLESSTAHQVLERCEERASAGGTTELVLRWCGVETVLCPVTSGSDDMERPGGSGG